MAAVDTKKPKQTTPQLISKFGNTGGFKGVGGQTGKTFSPQGAGYNPSSFKMTQNKGSGGK